MDKSEPRETAFSRGRGGGIQAMRGSKSNSNLGCERRSPFDTSSTASSQVGGPPAVAIGSQRGGSPTGVMLRLVRRYGHRPQVSDGG